MGDWEAALAPFKLQDVIPPHAELFTIKSDDNLTNALKILASRGVQALPVLDPDDLKPVGLIDTLDILYTAVKEAERIGIPLSTLAEGEQQPDLPFLEKKKVFEFCNSSGRNGCCIAYAGLPLSSTMDVLSSRTVIHRLPVVDGDGRLLGMVSQCRCLEFLSKRVFPQNPEIDVAAQKVIDIDYFRDVFSIESNRTVFEGYQEIVEKGIHGIAVTNDGILIGALTASDLRFTQGKNIFRHMQMRISDHLQATGKSPVFCVDHDTIGDVVTRMLANHVHRIFVVDDPQSRHLKGVVSLGDIILHLKTLSKIGL